MNRTEPLQVIFYRTEAGHEPVREWLLSLQKFERKMLGEDIKTVQFGWPIGMPIVRKLDSGLWEIRTQLENRIARVLFTLRECHVVLLHGFIKKSRRIPRGDLDLAKQRMRSIQEGNEHEE